VKTVETSKGNDEFGTPQSKNVRRNRASAGRASAATGSGTLSHKPVALLDAAQFLAATRDSGYRSTAFSLAELVDNAIQAEASAVSIDLRSNSSAWPIEILVTDDGHGMSETTLAAALAFGGSSRFGDRASLGRYGMGLPNGALSLARRIDVYTWGNNQTLCGTLDLDALIAKRSRSLPAIVEVERPDFLPVDAHGTAVRLTNCDRLEYRRATTIASKLRRDLGRIYRCYLRAGLAIEVNGEPVTAFDPLFLDSAAKSSIGASPFGDVLVYRLTGPGGEGTVRVRFSELPVGELHSLPSKAKRDLGITRAPNVSVLRAEREIDRGWFFMGGKRRENYDDWWRCEISFEPALDEMFGITHAKQEIRPTDELREILERDLEPIARALNTRVRRRFEIAKATTPLAEAEKQAARANLSRVPSPKRSGHPSPEDLRPLEGLDKVRASDRPYVIRIAEFSTTEAYHVVVDGAQTQLYLNVRHPLYHHIYEPLANSDDSADRRVATDVALVILAAARAEVGLPTHRAQRDQLDSFRSLWSDVLASFIDA
jgi:hypothetical protein